MLENTLFPNIGETVTKLPECDIHDKHKFPKPPHAFTLQEQFMETVNRVNDTLSRIVRQAEFMEKSVNEFTSKLSADNVTFKDLVVATYNQFSGTVTAEVNAFETEIKNSYQAFADDVKLNWDNFQLNYADFEKQINDKITEFETKTDTAFEEYKTLVNQGFADFQEEIQDQLTNHITETTGQINDHKGEMNEVYNNFRIAIESRLEQYNSNYVKSFNDYCTSMNNNLSSMERDFNRNYTEFTSAVNASISEFKNAWAENISARLDGQDAVINDAVLYMKTNLTASLRAIADEIISEGNIGTITTASYQAIKNRIPNIINVKDYFDSDYTVNSDGTILFENAVTKLNGYLASKTDIWDRATIYFPNGNYYFGNKGLEIPSFINVVGESKEGVIFHSNNSEYCIKIFSADSDNVEYVTLKNFHIKAEEEAPTYGILFDNPASHIILDNISIDIDTNAIAILKGSWVSELSNIDIANADIGILINGAATSTRLKNTYVMNSNGTAYKISGLGYSSWENVCADWCKNIVYDISHSSININGMGAECQESATFLKTDTATLNISNATVFTNQESADYEMLNIHNSNVIVNGVSIDTYDGEQHETEGKLYSLVNNAKLTINDMKSNTKFKTPSTSADPDNVFTYTDRNNNYTVNNHKTVIGMPIGADTDRGLKHADRDYLTNSIWSNNVGHPRNGLAHDDRYAIARQCGDLFINNQPYLSGVAFWQQVSSCEPITLEGDYVFTNNDDGSIKVTITNYNFSERAKAFFGENIQHAMYLYNGSLKCKFKGYDEELNIPLVYSVAEGECTENEISFDLEGNGQMSVNTTNNTITLPTSNQVIDLNNISEHPLIWLCSSDIANTEYRAVQHIKKASSYEMNTIKYLLQNNLLSLEDGFQIFEADLKKPIWHYNKKFYLADGTEY